MNIPLWILQILLALHTLTGAIWKLSHSEQNAPTLQSIPHGIWLVLIPLEILFVVGLIIPAFKKPMAFLAPVAAAGIAAEMLFFSAVHLHSGGANHAPLVYWLVVASVSSLLAVGRILMKPK